MLAPSELPLQSVLLLCFLLRLKLWFYKTKYNLLTHLMFSHSLGGFLSNYEHQPLVLCLNDLVLNSPKLTSKPIQPQ